ncbi:hypothetical protein RvY_00460 [Ramazzottius varieornatus]|uniref:Chitin-binding type-2 domain-containing protein n=1 Tax=Ramazzottius varieornatus TaxID=947166 RepID=A0A1D1UGY6_RAMVA|nr:hypothetical protein RvY_00460 [Ramazzottius varieornatus]
MIRLTLLAALAASIGFVVADENKNVTVVALSNVPVENATVVNRKARHWHNQVPRKYWEHTLASQQHYLQEDRQPSQLVSAALPRDLDAFVVSSPALPLQTVTLQRKDLPALTIASPRSLNPINVQLTPVQTKTFSSSQAISTPTMTFQTEARELPQVSQPGVTYQTNQYVQNQQPLVASRSFQPAISHVEIQSTPIQTYQEIKPVQVEQAREFVPINQKLTSGSAQYLTQQPMEQSRSFQSASIEVPLIQETKTVQQKEEGRSFVPAIQQFIASTLSQSLPTIQQQPAEQGRSFSSSNIQLPFTPESKPIQTEQARSFVPGNLQLNPTLVQSFQTLQQKPMETGRLFEFNNGFYQSTPQQESKIDQAPAGQGRVFNIPTAPLPVQDSFTQTDQFILTQPVKKEVTPRVLTANIATSASSFNNNNNNNNNFDVPAGRIDNTQTFGKAFDKSNNNILSGVPTVLTRMDTVNAQPSLTNFQSRTSLDQTQTNLVQPSQRDNIMFVVDGDHFRESSHQIPIASTKWANRPTTFQREKDVHLEPVSLTVPSSPTTFNVINQGAIRDTKPISHGIPQTPVIVAEQVTETHDRPDASTAVGGVVVEETVDEIQQVPDNSVISAPVSTPIVSTPVRPAASWSNIQQPTWTVNARPAQSVNVIQSQVRPVATTAVRDPVALQGQQYVFDFMAPPANADSINALLEQAIPGVTYPALTEVPLTSFTCDKHKAEGYYADTETGCQAYHRCDEKGQMTDYLCPNRTIFSQITLTCDWWYNVDCSVSDKFLTYGNSRIQAHSEDVPLFDSPPVGYVPAWAPLYHDAYFATQQKQLQDMQVLQQLQSVAVPTTTKIHRKTAQPSWSKF